MDKPTSLSVLIAAKDEEQTITHVIESHITLLRNIDFPVEWEIGILDDGSTDQTLQMAQVLHVRYPELKIWHNDTPSGIANAFKQLAENAQYEWIYITSGDGQFLADGLEKMLHAWFDNPITTLGVRVGRFRTYSSFRSLISWSFLIVTRLLFKQNLRDPGSVKIIKKIHALRALRSKSTMRDAEQLAIAAREDGGIQFVTIPFLPRHTGKANGVSRSNLIGNIQDSFLIIRSNIKSSAQNSQLGQPKASS